MAYGNLNMGVLIQIITKPSFIYASIRYKNLKLYFFLIIHVFFFVQTIYREPSNHSTITLCIDKTIVYKNITIVVHRGLRATCTSPRNSTNKNGTCSTLFVFYSTKNYTLLWKYSYLYVCDKKCRTNVVKVYNVFCSI